MIFAYVAIGGVLAFVVYLMLPIGEWKEGYGREALPEEQVSSERLGMKRVQITMSFITYDEIAEVIENEKTADIKEAVEQIGNLLWEDFEINVWALIER